MKYVGEFTNINNTHYKIEIVTNGSESETSKIVLGSNPFVTSMDSDGKTIYAPIKSTGATVELIINNIPTEFYNVNKHGIKVKLTNTSNNIVEWVGYATPCAYSQGFDKDLESLEIEAVDGLASLKDIPFRTTSKDIDTFLNIIFNILKISNCYRYLYVTKNIKLTSTNSNNILSLLRVTQANFYDAKDYENQPDDDVAMDCYDVLYEIMQYMGYTIIAHGEDVYIIDYDAIRNNNTNYFRYSLSGSTVGNPTNVTLSHSYHIDSNSYAENGSNFSLSEVFNQCVVIDEFNEIDSLLDGIDSQQNLTNITSSTDASLKNWFKNDSRFLESEVFTVKNKRNEDESFFVSIMKDDGSHNMYFVLGKFYKHEMITTKHYNHNNNGLMDENYFSPMCFSKLWDGKGANYVGYFTKKIESSDYNKWRADITSNWDGQSKDVKLQQFGKLCNITNIGNKKLVNYICCRNHDTNHIEHDKTTNYPYFTIKKNLSTIFGGDGGYIVLKGSLIRHDMQNSPFPMNGTCWRHNDEKNTSIYSGEGYFWSQLKWGNYYWESTGGYADQGDWKTTPSYFKIFYGDPTKEMKTDDFQDKDLKFYNNCGALWGVDEDGYYIPVPPNGNLTGTIEWTIYANKDTKGKWARNNKRDKKNSYNGHRPKIVLFKGLDITAGYSDDAMNDEAAKCDTVYTNDVTGYDNVMKMEDISFKICTYDNKTPSYSTVDYLSNGKSVYLDTTYNESTKMDLRMEEHFVVRNVSQYQEPRVLFSVNLKNNLGLKPWSLLTDKTISGKYFIVDTMNIDYRYNKIEINMIEKTNKYN